MARTTGRITYSLYDRKYDYNGVDRDIDLPAMIRLIRSKGLQERISKRTVFGYYGHQLRELYGLKVPETVIDENGKVIYLSPALVTIHLSIDDEGNVTHEQEFINNIAGNQAYRQFKAEIGGFSSAFYSPVINGFRTPQDYFGMDYVLRPNYHHNRCIAAIYDSLDSSVSDQYQQAYLKRSICEMYDSLEQIDTAYEIAMLKSEQAQKAQSELDGELKRKERRIQRAKANKEAELHAERELQAAMLLDSLPFEEFIGQADSFKQTQLVSTDEEINAKAQKKTLADRNAAALERFL